MWTVALVWFKAPQTTQSTSIRGRANLWSHFYTSETRIRGETATRTTGVCVCIHACECACLLCFELKACMHIWCIPDMGMCMHLWLCVCVPTNCAGFGPGRKAWKHPLCVFLPVFDQADRRPLFRAGWLKLCDRVLLGRKIAFLRVRYTNDGLDQVFQHFSFHDLSETSHWPC